MPIGIEGDVGRANKEDMRLIRAAIRRGWGVPDAVKGMVVKKLARIVKHSEDARDIVAASRTLILADKVDAEREGNDATANAVNNHLHLHQHSEGMNGTGLHSTERIERLRTRIAEQLRISGAGESGGD